MQDFQHQKFTFERAKDRDYYALLLEMGLGKSRIAIELAEYNHAQGRIAAVMVLCPKSLVRNWTTVEIPKHSSSPFVTYEWPAGKPVPEFNSSPVMAWLVLNHDAITREEFVEVFRAFRNSYGLFALVVDESTAFKSPKAQRTKVAVKLGKYASKKYILSGMPVPQSPLEAWSQFEILKPGILGSESYYSFMHRYAVKKDITFGMRRISKVVGYKNLEELTSTIKKYGSMLSKEECLDLPPKMFRTLDVPLTEDQNKIYKSLKEEALAYFNEEKIIAVNAVSLLIKLLQVAAGQIKRSDSIYEAIPSDRFEVISDLVEECAGKTVVWSYFVGASASIANALDKRQTYTMKLTSGMTPTLKADSINTWKNNPACKVLIASPEGERYGHTWVESSNVIYANIRPSLEKYIQSQERTHRIGQTKSVLYTNILSEGTVERGIYKILESQKDIAEVVMDRGARLALIKGEM